MQSELTLGSLKARLPLVELKQDENVVLAQYEGTWVSVATEEIVSMLENFNAYLHYNSDPNFLAKYYGYWLLVLGNGKMYTSRSKSDLLNIKMEANDRFAYLGIVGVNPNDPSNFTCLTL